MVFRVYVKHYFFDSQVCLNSGLTFFEKNWKKFNTFSKVLKRIYTRFAADFMCVAWDPMVCMNVACAFLLNIFFIFHSVQSLPKTCIYRFSNVLKFWMNVSWKKLEKKSPMPYQECLKIGYIGFSTDFLCEAPDFMLSKNCVCA